MFRGLIGKVSRWLSLGVVAVALGACGGGSNTCNDSFGGGCPDTVDPETGGTIDVVLSSQTVTAGSPATVTARVRDLNGDPMSNQVVDFSTAGGLGTFSAASALTNADGNAVVTLSPTGGTESGADSVVVTTDVGGTTLTATTGFQLTATEVTIASVTPDISTVDPYEQTAITVALDGFTVGVPVSVTLSSACVSKGRATLTPDSVTTSTGLATFTYRDAGCGAFDTIDNLQASVVGTAATATLTLTLTAPDASSISFVSASPDTIYLKGSGFTENSNVTFQVVDANGAGVPNTNVTLEPTTLAGGLLIDGGSVPVTKKTDSDGNVLVRINSGTVPTPVRVKATLADDTSISTLSSSLSIAVGLPSQLNFSISQGAHNIEGYNHDGTTNSYTIIASDRLGNPVPDGTSINFVSEGGQVEAVRFTALAGGLSSAAANFQTSDPRPVDGRVTVTAYALGEESFLDTNGDNVYTAGEDYQDLGDIFLDRLFNGTYSAAEDQFISLGIAGSDACHNASSSLLQLNASMPSRARSNTGASMPTCVSGWGRAYVRRAIRTIFSTSSARPTYGTSLPSGAMVAAAEACPAGRDLIIPEGLQEEDGTAIPAYEPDDTPVKYSDFGASIYDFGSVWITGASGGGVVTLVASDANPIAYNPMAAGTVITAAATQGLSVNVLGGTPVASSLSPTTAAIAYEFDEETVSGTITVTFRSPSGLSTSVSQFITMTTPAGNACP